jgi:small-conductance mechanosensitive channel
MSIEEIRSYLNLISDNATAQAAIVVVLSLIAAKISDFLITRVLKRAVRFSKTQIDDQIVSLLHRPVFSTVALLGFLIAIDLVIPMTYRATGDGILLSLITIVWTMFFVRLTTLLVNWMSHEDRRFQVVQAATAPLFDIGAKVIFLGAAVYIFLIIWQIDVTGWLASAGILGLAFGLAAKDTLSNLFAGVSILADAPYKIGDFIILDNSERGKVTKIGLRSTRVLTRDQIEVTVPNAIIATTKIINESGGPSPKHRIRVPVGVAYGTDVDVVEKLLLDVVQDQRGLASQPQPRVHFKAFGPSSLDFELRCWVDQPVLRGRAIHSLNTAVYKALNEHGIEIPYPKRDLYIKEMPESLGVKEVSKPS